MGLGMVANLQALNQHITKRHFKMESIKLVKGLIQKEGWLAKLNLCISIHSYPPFTFLSTLQIPEILMEGSPLAVQGPAPCTLQRS